MLGSTLVAEANAAGFLPDRGHVTEVWRIHEGYVVPKKTQSESDCERLRHYFQTSPFLPVQTLTQPQFPNKKRGQIF